MKDGLYRVVTSGFVAGFVVTNGVVTRSAPILRRRLSHWARKAVWICISLMVSLPLYGWAQQSVSGKIGRVIDGDTVIVKTPSGVERVRIKGIDAPELSQPGGRESRRNLMSLCPEGSSAQFTREGLSYNRTVGRLNCGYRDAGRSQIREGYARDAARYSRGEYNFLESKARSQQRGLWRPPTFRGEMKR